jgi:hypothetical protein
VTTVTTVVTITPNENAPHRESPRKATVKPTTPSPAGGLPATSSSAAAAVPLMSTALVRAKSGHVLIRTFAYPSCYYPTPNELRKPPAGTYAAGYYGVSVGQECGIFLDWCVRPLLLTVNSIIAICRDSVELRIKNVPGARHKKFNTWELARDWYKQECDSKQTCCKPFVGGPFDPHDEAEAELAKSFSAYMTI